MQRCWAQGYERTSARDLTAEMGTTGASLYDAFGDKRTLYRRAVDVHLRGQRARPDQRLEGAAGSARGV